MKKYRIVEFKNGGYGIQYKKSRWSCWKLIPAQPISFSNGALLEVARLRKLDEEEIKKKKMFEIKSVVEYD
jgi:hypothetical protein